MRRARPSSCASCGAFRSRRGRARALTARTASRSICFPEQPSVAKLDVIQIASPCTASWEAMKGDERVRHCLQCHLDVYDLSAMSREEAERFVTDSDGHACVRVVKRADGTVVTQDCTPARDAPPRACVPR